MRSVCAFTSVCEEDRCWLPQYVAEAERLRLPFVMLFDRCSPATIDLAAGHPLCVRWLLRTQRDGEFDERCKQPAFDVVVRLGYQWAMAWDVDETYEADAPRKIAEITELKADWVDVRWLNLWEDVHHVRTDGPFQSGHRMKFYNLQDGRTWQFDQPCVNGAKLKSVNWVGVEAKHDLVCLHHGMMTRELRELHKERWDRIYNTATRGDGNPYGFWNYALDEATYPPTVRPYP